MSAQWMQQVTTTRFDHDIFPFWDGLKEHRFLLSRCRRCGTHYWPMAFCPRHEDGTLEDMEWVPTSGRGTIFTYGITRRTANPLFKDEVPFVTMLVELEEGPIFPTRLAGELPGELRIGMPVEVDYHDVPETGMTLPLFRLKG